MAISSKRNGKLRRVKQKRPEDEYSAHDQYFAHYLIFRPQPSSFEADRVERICMKLRA